MSEKPLQILIIDDDRGCRLTAARFFSLASEHKTQVAENGRDGLIKAAQIRPDIILLDMSMPDMNGLEVMDALCMDPLTRDIPVIMITGGSLSDTDRDSLAAKQNFMMLEQKPANFGKLLGKIETALRPVIPRSERREAVSGDSLEPA